MFTQCRQHRPLSASFTDFTVGFTESAKPGEELVGTKKEPITGHFKLNCANKKV